MVFAMGEKGLFPGKARAGYCLTNADSQRGLRCSLKCKVMQLYSSATFHLSKALLLVEEVINFSNTAGCTEIALTFLSKIKASHMVATFEFQ